MALIALAARPNPFSSHICNRRGDFTVVDRDNMQEITNEASISGQQLKLKGANYVITGEVTDFGRKEVGDV